MIRVAYIGDGVVSNKLGAFQNGTIAFTEDDALARELAKTPGWDVTRDGKKLVERITIPPDLIAAEDGATVMAGGARHLGKHAPKKQDEGTPISDTKRKHPFADEIGEAGSK